MKPTTTESGEAESQAREEVLTSSSTAYVLVLDGEMSCGRAARLFSRRPASRFLRSAASVPEIASAAPAQARERCAGSTVRRSPSWRSCTLDRGGDHGARPHRVRHPQRPHGGHRHVGTEEGGGVRDPDGLQAFLNGMGRGGAPMRTLQPWMGPSSPCPTVVAVSVPAGMPGRPQAVACPMRVAMPSRISSSPTEKSASETAASGGFPDCSPISAEESNRAVSGKCSGLWRRSTPQAWALRCRIILACASGASNKDVAAQLGSTPHAVGRWRKRFVEHRIAGLGDMPRSGGTRTVTDEQVAAVVKRTLESAPKNATHWSTRAVAKETGLSQSTVSRMSSGGSPSWPTSRYDAGSTRASRHWRRTSAPGSPRGTPTPSPTSGPRPRTRSSSASPTI
ncbi:helix-turn-helix domain-containing protein [Streptomyces sp. NPDC000931]|uniref:helix-turn-helix domain-containing protein n=1 Tax=Streptomyces sp. NPDC000931 TaxID=3154372 RepID=UPI00332DF642